MRLVQISRIKSSRDTPPEVKIEYEKKCQSCGACCSYYAWSAMKMPVEDGALVGNLDYTFKATKRIKYVHPDKSSYVWTAIHWLRRRKIDGWWRCIALEGNVGQSVSCSVYKDRPSACSAFEPGSDACKEARKWAGLEAADA